MTSSIRGLTLFSEVLAKGKSKEEQSHILQYQKEIRDKVQHYRAMELDIQEKVMKDREEKEALAAKNVPMATNLAIDKGKGPMEEIPQASVDQ